MEISYDGIEITLYFSDNTRKGLFSSVLQEKTWPDAYKLYFTKDFIGIANNLHYDFCLPVFLWFGGGFFLFCFCFCLKNACFVGGIRG